MFVAHRRKMRGKPQMEDNRLLMFSSCLGWTTKVAPSVLYLGLALLEESVTQALRPVGYSESDPVQNPNHSVLTLHGWRICLGLCSGLIPWNLSLRPNWDNKRFANSWRWSLGGCGAGCLNNKRMAGLWFHLDRLLFFPLFALLFESVSAYFSLSLHISLPLNGFLSANTRRTWLSASTYLKHWWRVDGTTWLSWIHGLPRRVACSSSDSVECRFRS